LLSKAQSKSALQEVYNQQGLPIEFSKPCLHTIEHNIHLLFTQG